ncbi:MAG TPA: hypothetical protein VIJ64_02185 [Candidatus Lustribacter sp.]
MAALLAGAAVATAGAQSRPPLDGDQLLARAGAAPGLQSYSVPVHFDVHMHKPIGIRTRADGTAYFRAPAQAALAITRATGIVGHFFRGDYKLDVVPQAWAANYHVVAVSQAVVAGIPVFVLRALPRGAPGDLTAVIFTVSTATLKPVAAEWQYGSASSIRVAYVNGRVGTYTLPLQATIAVDLPRYRLDAHATYGSYALNAPVPDSIFARAK